MSIHCVMIIMYLTRDAYELRGDMTGKIFRLGQKVRVRVADADKMLKTVDFVLAEED